MQKHKHIIKKQVLEFKASDQKGARELQELVSHVYRTKVTPLLNKICEQYDQEDAVIQIENLEIDLGVLKEDSIAEELPQKIESLFAEELNKRIFYLGKEGFNSHSLDKRSPVTKSEMTSFIHFLQYGTFKWDGNPAGKKVNSLFGELLQSSKSELRNGLSAVLNQQNARKRLIFHFDQQELKKVIELIADQKEQIELISFIEELTNIHQYYQFATLSKTAFSRILWDVTLHSIVKSKSAGIVDHKILQHLFVRIEQATGKLNTVNLQKTQSELRKAIDAYCRKLGSLKSNTLKEFKISTDAVSYGNSHNTINENTESAIQYKPEGDLLRATNEQTVPVKESEELSEDFQTSEKQQSHDIDFVDNTKQVVDSKSDTVKSVTPIVDRNKEFDEQTNAIVSGDSIKNQEQVLQQQKVSDHENKKTDKPFQQSDEVSSVKHNKPQVDQSQAGKNEIANFDKQLHFTTDSDQKKSADEGDVSIQSELVDKKKHLSESSASKTESNGKASDPEARETKVDQVESSDKGQFDTVHKNDASDANKSKETVDSNKKISTKAIENEHIQDEHHSASEKVEHFTNSQSDESDVEMADSQDTKSKKRDELRSDVNSERSSNNRDVKSSDNREYTQSSNALATDKSLAKEESNTDSDFTRTKVEINTERKNQEQLETQNDLKIRNEKSLGKTENDADQSALDSILSDNQKEEGKLSGNVSESSNHKEQGRKNKGVTDSESLESQTVSAQTEEESKKIEAAIAMQKILREERTRERNGVQERSDLSRQSVNEKEQSPPITWNVPPKPLEEAWINNAGIVLIWPFLPTLFKGLEWMEDNEFKSEELQYKAVWFLQFLATGSTEADESELVLNKLLTGLRAETPVPAAFNLTDEEKEEGEHLLKVVIQNWSVLKGTSVDGFRATFLRKEGLLKKDFTGWKLYVERSTMDVLLEKLPWSYSVIKLPWVTEMIFVEW